MGIEAARLSVVVDADTSKAEAGLSRMGGVVSGAGAKFATFAAAGIGAASVMGAGLAKAGMSLEDALMPIGTLVGRNTAEFDELSKAVIAFAKGSPMSPAEIGLGAYEALSSGVEGTANVMAALQASSDLAQAGLGTLGGSMDIITSAMNAFASEGLTAQQAAEIFFGAIDKGKATTESLSQGFGAIAPLAATAGVSFNDLMAATAALTSTGLPAAEAYTGLRSALTNVIKPSDQAAKMARKLGIDFSAAHLQNVGLPRFLEEIAVATGGNSEVMAQLFGDVQGLNAVLALTGTSAEAFKENLTGLAESGSGLSARAGEVADTWSNRWREAKNKFSIWAGEIGLKLADWLEPRVARFIDWWKAKWPTIHEVAANVAGKLRTAAVFVADEVLPRIVDAAQAAVSWWRRNWPQIRETVANVIGWLNDNVVPVVRRVVGYVVGYAQDLIAWWRRNWPAISEAVTHVMNVVRGVIERVLGFVQALWRNYGDKIVAYVRGIFNIIRGIVQTVMSYIRGVIETVMHLINGDWGKAWDAFKRLLSGVWDGVVRIVTGAVEMVVAVITGLGRAIAAGARAAWPKITEGLGAAVDGVLGFFRDLPGKVLTAIGLLPGMVGNVARMALIGMKNVIAEFPGQIFDAAKGIGSKFLDGLKSGLTAAAGFAGDIARGIVRVVKDAWNEVARLINDFVPNKLGWGRFSIDLPDNPIPTFDLGGVVGGPRGAPVLALLHGGETVLPTHRQPLPMMRPAAGAGGVTINGGIHIHANDERGGRLAMRGAMAELARDERLNGPRYVRAS